MKRLLIVCSSAMTGASIFAYLVLARLTGAPLECAVAVMLAGFLVSVPLAGWAANRAAGPVNRMDLDHPGESAAFEEFAPLVSSVRRKNEAIAESLSEMRRTQIEFSAITNHMREGLLVLDKGARVLSCNESALALLHAGPGAAASRPSVLALRRDEPFRAVVEQVLGGAPADVVLQAGGRHLQLAANPVKDRGETRGAVLFISDVTEREDRERLRREFSANVSHELKTPIMAVSGYAEIMARGVAKEGDMPAFALKIYNEAQRLIMLVDDIMMLSRLDEKPPMAKERVELGGLVQSVMERAGPSAAKRGVALRFDRAGGDACVWGVRQVLDEMAFNLIDNAVKYNREGGRVDIEARAVGGGAVLAVSDTGIGIPPAEQGRVFERFYRVDKSRASAAPGTGLGLSIVKHGAALHNARVSLKSDGKSGTRVEVEFPGGQ